MISAMGPPKLSSKTCKAPLCLAFSRVCGIPQWFPDPQESVFFICCMTVIAQHDRDEEEMESFRTFNDGTVPTTRMTVVPMKMQRINLEHIGKAKQPKEFRNPSWITQAPAGRHVRVGGRHPQEPN